MVVKEGVKTPWKMKIVIDKTEDTLFFRHKSIFEPILFVEKSGKITHKEVQLLVYDITINRRV